MIWKRLKATFFKGRLEKDLDDELRFHLEMLADENGRKGMAHEEAVYAARRSFGGVEQVKESYRDIRGSPLIESLIQDLRFGMRILRRTPGFTTVAALTLALGIGTCTGVFSVVYAVIMRPLRFPQPERVMAILSTAANNNQPFLSAPGVFFDWSSRATSFESIAGARSTVMTLTGVDEPRRMSVAATSFDLFSLLGVRPVLGRTFTKAEDQTAQPDVVMLDAGFWRREFGGDPGILGRPLLVDDRTYRVVGVLPANVRFANFGVADVWSPLAASERYRGGGDVLAVGRLRPGVTREAAQAEMESITKVIGREHQEDSRHGVLVRPLQEWMVGDVRRMFLTLVGAVLFVLLICCANIANLLMARAAARQREMAIRASLGAGRLRLLRQALIESLLLALIGGTLGFGLAVAIVRAVPAIHAFRIPRVEEVALDYSVFLIAAAVTLASGILFGLAPAFQAGRGDIGVSLYKGDAPALGRLGGHYFRNALVVAQIALALVLLAGAGLMTNSLVRLLRIDLGFARSNILTIGTSLLPRGYDQKRRAEFQRLLAAEVAGMPGVEQVGISDYPPLYAVLFPYYLRVKGSDTRQKVQAMARHVDPGYLRVTGIRLLAGRDLERADENRGPVPALINTTAARALFGTESPLGRQVTTGYRRPDVLEFVGVVGDAHQIELTSDPGPQIYLPLTYGHASYVLARVSPRSGELAAAIRAVVRRLEPEAPAPVISTVDAMFARQTAQPRFYLTLLGAFAALSVLLAAVGIYGVISYTVARRTHEFGVRMALGAGPSDILRLVLRTGIGLTAAGTVLGLAGALALTRLLASMLYGVRPNDPLTLGCVAVLLAGIALAACYLAARRATAVDPNVALKCE